MTFVVLCADKGSPGVTTAALALAVVSPGPSVVAEVDPSGGDLALRLTDGLGRFELRDQPNLLTFAAAAGRGPTADLLLQHCQAAAGLHVLRGAVSAEQASGLDRLWPAVAQALRSTSGANVLADVGRLLPGSPAWPVVSAADCVVVVATASAEGLAHMRERVCGIAPLGRDTAVVLVSSDQHGHDAMRCTAKVLDRDDLPAEVIGFLALDSGAVARLERGERTGRVARSLLVRTAREVSQRLRQRIGSTSPATAQPMAPDHAQL
jgi:hypothetical protein